MFFLLIINREDKGETPFAARSFGERSIFQSDARFNFVVGKGGSSDVEGESCRSFFFPRCLFSSLSEADLPICAVFVKIEKTSKKVDGGGGVIDSCSKLNCEARL